MLINTMTETRLNNNSYSKKENPNSGLKVIILPLIGFILLVAIAAALLFGQISGNQHSLLNWVNISIIIISLLLFIPGLFLLILILGLFMVLYKTQQPMQSGLRSINQFVLNASKILTKIAELILKPIFFLESIGVFINKHKA